MHEAGSLFNDRRRADSFGDNAALYDKVRPTYSAVMIDLLMGEEPGTALDVGCGTAIVARLLVARGIEVLGLEPDARMAHVARSHGVTVEEATFEGWDAGSRTFDLLTAGQVWHWVDPQIGATKAARVLRPGGRIGLFWNQPRPEGSVRYAMDKAYDKWAPTLGEGSVLLGRRDPALYEAMAEALRHTGGFVDVELIEFAHQITYGTGEWLALAATHSDHHTLPPEQRSCLLRALRAGLDDVGGRFTMRFETLLVTGRTSKENL